MKSEQIINVMEQTISILLSLRWHRISNINSGLRGFSNWQKQCFEFLKADGTIACTVEFEHTEYDEGAIAGSLWGRIGKIFDNSGVIVIEAKDLVDVNARPKKHPLNDLHEIIWGKESGGPVSEQGKFPETITLEKFIESLRG